MLNCLFLLVKFPICLFPLLLLQHWVFQIRLIQARIYWGGVMLPSENKKNFQVPVYASLSFFAVPVIYCWISRKSHFATLNPCVGAFLFLPMHFTSHWTQDFELCSTLFGRFSSSQPHANNKSTHKLQWDRHIITQSLYNLTYWFPFGIWCVVIKTSPG